FVIAADNTRITNKRRRGEVLLPRAPITVSAINSPAPDSSIPFANANEPTKRRIVFISIDLIAFFSVIILEAIKIKAPTQAETYNSNTNRSSQHIAKTTHL